MSFSILWNKNNTKEIEDEGEGWKPQVAIKFYRIILYCMTEINLYISNGKLQV